MFSYIIFPLANMIVLFITILLGFILIGDNFDVGYEFIFYIIAPVIGFYAYIIPFCLSVVYAVFGANFFLFSWVDNLLVFVIKHWVSNITMIVFLINPLIAVLAYASQDNGNNW